MAWGDKMGWNDNDYHGPPNKIKKSKGPKISKKKLIKILKKSLNDK